MKERIFIAALDWGLGHTTRIIPIINTLLGSGADIFVGANITQKTLLQQEFNALTFLEMPGYGIQLKENQGAFSYLKEGLKIIKGIRSEEQLLQQYHKKYQFTKIISDHRYGCCIKGIENILICHQLQFKLPFYLKLGNYFHRKLMAPFDEIWVPDFESDEKSLAGFLSRNFNNDARVKYLGLLSRFEKVENTNANFEILVILSGPSPQKEIFYKNLKKQLATYDAENKVIWLLGNVASHEKLNKNEFAHLPSNEFQILLNAAKLVVSRCGYSTLMDLSKLDKKAILIPTPGQFEQEYLGAYHKKMSRFEICNIEDLGRKTKMFLEKGH